MSRAPVAGERRFEVKLTAETHFSWLRTRMSTERTLMSWVRTGTALIGFGFTIFQVAARLPSNTALGPDGRPDVDQTFLQPFVTYTFPNGFGINANTETTYDWEREQWTVPIQLGVSKVLKLGAQPIQVALNERYWAERPSSAPEWGIRLVVVFLFPE
jgi:uncharacterized membrane protein YidH (DUF202 family)